MHNFNFDTATIDADDWINSVTTAADAGNSAVLVIAGDSSALFPARSLHDVKHIVVTSRDFNDGRFFSIARQIRLQGYLGHLTIVGNVLTDQYTALRCCGFDDVIMLEDVEADHIVGLDQAIPLAANNGTLNPLAVQNTAAGKN